MPTCPIAGNTGVLHPVLEQGPGQGARTRAPVVVRQRHRRGLLAQADRLAQSLAGEGELLPRVDVCTYLQPSINHQSNN